MFTYDPTNTIGAIRLLIGDTNASSAKFQDEELQSLYDRYLSVEIAASWALESLASIAAQQAKTVQTESYRVSLENLAKHLLETAKELRKNSVSSPYIVEQDSRFEGVPSVINAGSGMVW